MGTKRTTGIFRKLVLAGSVAVGALVSGAQADNMTDAMIGAYKTSGLLEQNRALLRAADEDVALSVSGLRPVINWISSAERSLRYNSAGVAHGTGHSTTLFTGLRLNQLLYDGGATRISAIAAQETVLATRQALVSIEQQILLRAVVAYTSVLLQQENVALRQNNLRLLREELRAAQDRFDVGEVTRTDVSLAESRVAAAEASLTDARGALIDAKSEYANAVGNDPGVVTAYPTLPKRVASVSTARSIALQGHPDLLNQQHRVKAAELTVQAQNKTLGPSVSFQADLGLTNQDTNSSITTDNLAARIDLSQPLYRGGSLSAGIRRVKAVRDAERSALITVQRNVVQGVDNAFVSLDVARANITSRREQIRAAQVAFDGIREEATLGARTTLDVLQAEQELLNANTAHIQAQAEQIIASFSLLSAQGLLTAERLGLAVEIYDPLLYYNLVKGAPAKYSKQGRDLDRVLEALGKK
ncbi:TolC family outer membrane protein [Aliisedimentitalea scapharcae]|uniref:TolC family outer membrane protein n=1 Tax=Aliisedimentitalea scapharcae TaxID=1524259 RepID=A0ABZ2XWX4_9RHOB